jgi:hypothetical protein
VVRRQFVEVKQCFATIYESSCVWMVECGVFSPAESYPLVVKSSATFISIYVLTSL